MANKIKIGMRVSTRREGTGTIVDGFGDSWIVKFDDNNWNGPVYSWNIWSEDGDTHSDSF